jgi:hypothetical protein
MIFIKVTSPAGRAIYVDGDYSESEGLAPTTIVLDAGSHDFNTRTKDGVIDYQGSVSNVPDGASQTIALQPIASS